MSALAVDFPRPAFALALRDYQRDALAAISAAEARGIRRQLAVLPTGSGKTVIFAHLTKQRGGRALILAHRDELIGQAVDKYRMIDPDADLGVVKAARDEHDRPIVVASIQTLARPQRLRRLAPAFDLVIVDEAHHAAADSYRRILRHVGSFNPDGPLTVGFTATADRGDGVGLAAVFEEIVYELPMLDLIEQGYLADLRAVQVRLAVDFGALRVRAGDFVEAETERALLDADAPEQVAAAYRQHAPGRKGIVFAPTIRVAREMAAAFNLADIPAEALDGETPADTRRAILRRLRAGETQVVANCAVLTEGFDEPTIDCIVIGRPTKSRPLYQQMVGRGSRRFPGKDDCLIIDVVGATTRHDLITAATLFGLPPSALATKTVAEAVAARTQPLPAAKPAGELVAATVELFRRRPVHWVAVGDGRHVLATGDGRLELRPRGAVWDVLQLRRQQAPTTIAANLSFDYAVGVAEDHARAAGAGPLLAHDAPWRGAEPTARQLQTLRRFGVRPAPGLTRGEASDLISAGAARRFGLVGLGQ